MFTVPTAIYSERLSTCNACPHFVKSTGSCGTLILGGKVPEENTVTKYRSKKRLCGCVVKFKAKLIWESCPLEKWGAYKINEQKRAELEEWTTSLLGKGYLQPDELKRLYREITEITGLRHEVKTCSSCVKDAIEKLRLTVKKKTENV